MKVLIAEDDVVSRRLLKSHLEKWDYQVTETADGKEALAAFELDPHPIVIADWMMPGLDGIGLIHHIRAKKLPVYTYIILCTARTQREDLIQGMEAGWTILFPSRLIATSSARIAAGLRMLTLEHSLAEQNRILRHTQSALVQSENSPASASLPPASPPKSASRFPNSPIHCFSCARICSAVWRCWRPTVKPGI